MSEQAKVLLSGSIHSNPIKVDKSGPRGGLKEEIVFRVEDEVQIVHLPAPSHQTLSFINTIFDSSPHHDRFRKKRPTSSATAPLRCEGQPHFEGIPDTSEDTKFFYNELFFFYEGDIFVSAYGLATE